MKPAPVIGLVLLTVCQFASAADYVRMPGGRFESVLPQGAVPTATVPVDIAPFEMRAVPVTAGEFLAFVRAHPEWRRDRAPQVFSDKRYLIDWRAPLQLASDDAQRRPVTNVSWFAAKAFCE